MYEGKNRKRKKEKDTTQTFFFAKLKVLWRNNPDKNKEKTMKTMENGNKDRNREQRKKRKEWQRHKKQKSHRSLNQSFKSSEKVLKNDVRENFTTKSPNLS